MANIQLDKKMVEYAVYGGAVLGGGGGGWIEEGLQIGRLAVDIGQPVLLTEDEVQDEDLLVTVSLVGAPAANHRLEYRTKQFADNEHSDLYLKRPFVNKPVSLQALKWYIYLLPCRIPLLLL